MTKIVCISDTHLAHEDITIPKCDFLIHSGDATYRGSEQEIRSFANWFNRQPAKHLIYTPGNHEVFFEKALPLSKAWFQEECPKGHLLLHEEITIDGLKIFGSPWTPEFGNWAFMYSRFEQEGIEKWDSIPNDVDILVTHGPPQNILDRVENPNVYNSGPLGCYDLRERIKNLKNLKLHVFGHIHSGHGIMTIDNTIFVNASVMDEMYDPFYPPTVVDL